MVVNDSEKTLTEIKRERGSLDVCYGLRVVQRPRTRIQLGKLGKLVYLTRQQTCRVFLTDPSDVDSWLSNYILRGIQYSLVKPLIYQLHEL